MRCAPINGPAELNQIFVPVAVDHLSAFSSRCRPISPLSERAHAEDGLINKRLATASDDRISADLAALLSESENTSN